MDTPKKTTTEPSPSSFLSKYEDSPVFNYISTLSPIKPFNLGHCGQSFHLLGFSSPQALQTPPTSPKDAKITRASYATDVAKNNYSQNCETKTEILDAIEPSDLRAEEANRNDNEVNISSSEKSSKLISEISRSLQYESNTPENNVVQCDTLKPIHEFNVARREILPVKTIGGNSKDADCSIENGKGVQEIQTEQNKETCEWENFVCEASDILNFHSPNKESYDEQLDDRCVDSGMLSFVSTVLQPPNELNSDQQQMESACSVISENHHMEVPPNKRGEIENSHKSTQLSSASNARAVFSEEVVHFLRTEVDDKSSSRQQQQTTRRRCLVYEMSGSHYRKLLADTTGGSPSPMKLAANPNTANDKPLTVTGPGSNKFSSALPSIGLHLNALAAAAKDKIIVKRQTLTCRRQLISSPSNAPFESVISDAKPLAAKITPEVVVKEETDEQKDGVQVSGNVSLNSILGEDIKFPQSSPKKKRRKSDNLGESESCKRCNCKRSKCLKLYCECFAAGLYCVEPCNCQDCFNKPIHEDTVLETRRQIESRNPLAFAPKVIRSSGTPSSVDELSKTPASARHKRGCNCKKSGCLKKYCECFEGGVGCSLSCRCEGCKNTFGCKKGPESIGYQETKYLQRNASDVSSLDSVPGTDEENHDHVTPEPPKNARQPVWRPFHIGVTIPQFPIPSQCFPQSCSSQTIDETDEATFEEDNNKIEVAEEDAPETLGDYLLPTTYVKSASPNCKRISPPHCDFETSPSWKSCRKLILRSIPPIPNFSPEEESVEFPEKNNEDFVTVFPAEEDCFSALRG